MFFVVVVVVVVAPLSYPLTQLYLSVQDQFDTMDFSDNEIRKLEGFPVLKRLRTLLLCNNRIV